ncbi:hypothetical protein [Streptomyces griseocarneus]|uniref:hypothetical protein n=1 Tax=Streptomyces griseocarneus TaxID=51201 RepID=UPI00167C8971|nr:hypothetical protein [Streptomyces griseocarneus]MBZ6473704.1 hypothetical protein [Streptomyces griseocarneus]GHG64649.1 hypothetical protein GCM10018779_34720 [Streptomyces griseocarneus]
MSSRPERHATTEASLLPLPHVWRTAVWTGFAALALLSAVHAVGQRKPAWHVTGDWWGPFEGLFEWVMQCVVGVARLVTSEGDGAPLNVRLGCLFLLIVCFVLWRRAMLARNAYRPGPVDVQKLVASSPEVEQQVEGLTAQLRKYLSETNLYPPSALPAEAPAENFIDLLGDVDIEPKKLGTSLLRLFSRLRPKVAYTVRGVLRERAQEPRCGVTVTVTSYAMRGSRTETRWEKTWDAVVRSAGNWVMASLVPVTRAGKRPPWQAWHGQDLKPELFAAYQDGRRLSKERRLDDALERFYTALSFDPANLYFRTQIAGIQEKLWLHMDALETYYGAMMLDGCTNRQREQYLGLGPWDIRRWIRRYRGWRAGLLEVRYRYAVVLGVGERLASEWCTSDSDNNRFPQRAHARREIQAALIPAFTDRHWRAFKGWTRVTPQAPELEEELRIKGWLTKLLEAREEEWLIRLVFQQACVDEMRRIARDSPWSHLLPLVDTRHRGTFTRASLRLNRKVWAPLRLAWADRVRPHGSPWFGVKLAGVPPNPTWLNDVKQLDKRVQYVLDRRVLHWLKQWARDWLSWFRLRRPWQDSYNAACVYAAAMNYRPFKPQQDRLARLAVTELENATRTDRNGSHSLMRSWVLMQDPDLNMLRRKPCFIRFEREVYPHATPDHHRPMEPVAAETTAYHRRILQTAARVMEHTWRVRRKQLLAEPDVVAQWFASEREAWDCVYQFARNGGRDWRVRERLLQAVRGITDPALWDRYGLPPGLPELDDLLDDASRSEPQNAKKRVKEASERTKELLDSVGEYVDTGRSDGNPCVSPVHRSAQWLAAIRRDPASFALLPRSAAWQVCWDFEAVWRALDEHLDPERGEDDAPLREALLRLREPP